MKDRKLNANEIAAKRLASGARTEKELIDFLCKKGIDREEAEKVAKEFREDGYIDDLRYAKDYIAYGEGKGWGKGRIARELSKKGVDSETVKSAYEEREDTVGLLEGECLSEEDRALQVIEKMMRGSSVGASNKLDEKTRSRIARRLFSYGYKTSDIYGAIKRFESDMN